MEPQMLCNIIYFAEISQTVSWVIMFDVEKCKLWMWKFIMRVAFRREMGKILAVFKDSGKKFQTKTQLFLKSNLKS